MMESRRKHSVAMRIIVATIVLSLCIIASVSLFYSKLGQELKRNRTDTLSAVASLKVDQITKWREERISDATIIAGASMMQSLIEQAQYESGGNQAAGEMATFLAFMKQQYGYTKIEYFVTGTGRKELTAGVQYVDELLEKAATERKVVFSDIYQEGGPSGEEPRISVIVPFSSSSISLGMLHFQIDPRHFLYEFIQTWPFASRTAETLLVRREGNEVVFPNALRHRKDTAIPFRLPLDTMDLPAAMALHGVTGVVEGLDYRRVPVLAVIRPIPHTQWFLIAKIDRDEIFENIKPVMDIMLTFVFVMVLIFALIVIIIWQRESSRLTVERRRDELEREVLEQQYDYLTKYANDMIFLMDADLRIVEANDRAVEAFGYTRDELVTMTLKDLFIEQHCAGFDLQYGSPEQDRGWVYETVTHRRDGSSFPVEVSARHIKRGDETFYQAIIRDITERQRSRQKLLVSEKRYRELFDTVKSGVAVYEAFDDGNDFLINDFNRAGETIEGKTRDDIIGKRVTEVFPGIKDFGLFEVLRRVWKTGRSEYFPEAFYSDALHGGGWRENCVYKLPSGEIVAVYDDITERKCAEEDLKRLNEELEARVIERTSELEKANKEMEAFSYSVSHDLRAPLRSIEGFSRALLEDYHGILDDQGKDFLGRIRKASQSMEILIDDMLRLSRISRVEMHHEKVDLSAIANEIAEDFQNNSGGRRVDFVIQEDVLAVGDAHLLRLVMENLLDNALKFSRNNPEARIEFGIGNDTGKQVFFVRDNGVGFDMSYSNMLFEPFQRLHPRDEFEGTGIGLANVKRIIDRHGGSIRAESREGEGATFLFSTDG